MITAGIDVGFNKVKIVLLKDGKVIAKAIDVSGTAKRAAVTDRLWKEALAAAGISQADVEKVVVTGQGKKDIAFADMQVVEPVADAAAARFLCPEATSVVDIGADQFRVVTLGEGDTIQEVVLNQKCAGGLGTFLTYMARRLEMSLDEFSALDPHYGDCVVNDGCPVFAELDAQSLLNRSTPVKDVACAIIRAVAVRMNSILDDKIRPSKTNTLLIGGVTKNQAMMTALRERSGIAFIIPEDAEFAGALGAALIAAG